MEKNKTILTDQELLELKLVHSQKARLSEELAAISIAQFELNKRKQSAEHYYNSIQELESVVISKLENVYGRVRLNIDLETGEILPE